MSKLLRRTLIGVAVGVVVYVVAVLVFGAREVAGSLAEFGWWSVAVALVLSSANYLLRFWKWELALDWLDIRGGSGGLHEPAELSLGRSLEIYLAGLSMSVTPGKVGEVLRSVLLKASNQVPFTRTAPVVVADRLSDLIALVVLTLIGIANYAEYIPWVIATSILVAVGVAVLGSPRLFGGLIDLGAKLPLVGGLFEKARGMVDSAAVLMRLRYLGVLTAISVVGWGLECVGFWLILNAFPGVEASLFLCTFLWAATTIVGALSLLPGGIGATEGSLVWLLPRLAVGVTVPLATAATLLIRGCTLWYGELVGAAALALFMRDPQLRAAAAEAQSAHANRPDHASPDHASPEHASPDNA